MTFDQLKQEYSKCTACPKLCKSRTQVVFGSRNLIRHFAFYNSINFLQIDFKLLENTQHSNYYFRRNVNNLQSFA